MTKIMTEGDKMGFYEIDSFHPHTCPFCGLVKAGQVSGWGPGSGARLPGSDSSFDVH